MRKPELLEYERKICVRLRHHGGMGENPQPVAARRAHDPVLAPRSGPGVIRAPAAICG